MSSVESSARPTLPETMLRIAEVLAARATCPKLSVGCVLVDQHHRVLATGYNGVPKGMVHCTTQDCGGRHLPTGSDTCLAVHAEQNAVIQCPNPDKIAIAYVTHEPCLRCTKMLLNTGCQVIVFLNKSSSDDAVRAKALWAEVRGSHTWVHFNHDFDYGLRGSSSANT